MDLIKQSGGEPANFLDVGGTADAERVETGFRIILRDPKVKAILVNIFGGIVSCDRVAQGIVDAYKNMGDAIKVPIIVRLQGTNAVEAKELIDNSGLDVISVVEFKEAANKVQEVLELNLFEIIDNYIKGLMKFRSFFCFREPFFTVFIIQFWEVFTKLILRIENAGT